MKKIKKAYDFIVVGGGLSGLCAAIAAARHGVHTALIQNRAMLGGNASSEIRVHINGAGRNDGYHNAIESGIVLELMMENMKRNPQNSYAVHDKILWEKAFFQQNLDLYLNTNLQEAHMEGKAIRSVIAVQNTTETEFEFEAELFADTTGDATLADLAGADYTIGREARSTYGESLAPEVADNHTMGNTVLFSTVDMGKPVPFHRPDWAYEITEEILGSRIIDELNKGYWWIELGGDHRSTISDAEDIQVELIKYVYGVFDYIKNSGKFEASSLTLDRIAPIPGKRESRRVYGDYVLTQNDIDCARRFEDAVAYGGWTMDAHTIGGLEAKSSEKEKGTVWNPVDDIYTIPYRCIYSRNIENLYVGGRAISASHMALSSTRVMGTCAVIGQAIGTAASIAVEKRLTPRQVNAYIPKLQQMLIRDDCYIPGIPTNDTEDLISGMGAQIDASSFVPGGEPENINGEYARRVNEREYAWISGPLDDGPQWIRLKLSEPTSINQILLRFDPDFSKPMFITTSRCFLEKRRAEMPEKLTKSYTLSLKKDGVLKKSIFVNDNYQRVNLHCFEPIYMDEILLRIIDTYGDPHGRIFEIRAYYKNSRSSK